MSTTRPVNIFTSKKIQGIRYYVIHLWVNNAKYGTKMNMQIGIELQIGGEPMLTKPHITQ